MPQNAGSKEDLTSKNIQSRHNEFCKADGATGSPNSVGVCWQFEFIRECMKINKIRLVFVFCYLLSFRL